MRTLYIKIAGLAGALREAPNRLVGSEMNDFPLLESAWLMTENERIVDFGEMKNLEIKLIQEDVEVVDVAGGFILPGLCDPHTHMVFAKTREGEFVDRINGLTYEEIAEKGGGILNSAQVLQNTSEEDLFVSATERLNEVASLGTVAVEIKSGYGLSVAAELKMLRVIQALKEISPIPIKASFLGAHAIPTQFKTNREEYIRQIIEEMLPVIADENLADYIDVFCDRGFFTQDETERILLAGKKYGLRAKIHANELDFTGGIQAGVKLNALSVDHLECTGDEEIELLKGSETMPTLLPSTAFFLGINYPPARKMIDAGLGLALASDYNPGSSPSGRMPFIWSLACIKLKMRPMEALAASTLNAAYAMGMEKELGSITPGKRASFIITYPAPSIHYFPYSFGSDWIRQVVIDGN